MIKVLPFSLATIFISKPIWSDFIIATSVLFWLLLTCRILLSFPFNMCVSLNLNFTSTTKKTTEETTYRTYRIAFYFFAYCSSDKGLISLSNAVTYACNSNYSGGGNWEDCILRPIKAKS
jgi:hypothetical protein